MQVKDYKSASEYLKGGKDKTSRPLPGRSTRLESREGGAIAVRYHNTDVVTYIDNGLIALDSGGWRTVTTKARLNEYLPHPWHVYQDKGIWYLGRGYWSDPEKATFVFRDDIMINPETGEVTGEGENPTEKLKMKKAAAKFASKYVKSLLAGEVPAPSGGDCWHCLMVTKTGETLGELSNSDHIVSHIEEGYLVPSLLVRAIEVFPVGMLIRSVVGEVWETGKAAEGWAADIAKEQLTRSLCRYLYRQLGLAA